MTKITFACDRCEVVVEGTHSPEATGGFYIVSSGYWLRFRRDPLEHLVCDTCIQSMPAYQALYGY